MGKDLQTRARSMAFAAALLLSSAVSAQTRITDEAGLKAIANDLNGNYVLAADITLTGQWTPLGTEASPFTGTFDGGGHSIKGLNVTASRDLDNSGLFGYAKGATLKNVSIIGAKVDGDEHIGILLGNAKEVTISGVMTSGVVTGRDHVGGIVGDASGSADNGEFTSISNCMSTAGVFSRSYQAGGIAGIVNAGNIDKCFFYGSATAEDGFAGAGGISALIDGGSGMFTNNVSAAIYIKGAASVGNSDPNNNFEHAHSIVGWNNNGTPNFGTNLSSAATVIYSAGKERDHAELAGDFQGTETSVADLQKSATYTGLDWGTEWSLADGRYPVLAGMTVPFDGDDIAVYTPADVNVVGGHYESGAKSTLGRTVNISSSDANVATVTGTKISFVGAGTATITYTTTGDAYVKGATYTQTFTVTETNYNIATAQDLLNIKNNTEGDYKLTADIDMSGVSFSPLPDFTGSLDGQGHVIRNLTFNNANQDQAALFATTHGATIKNLGIENANIVGNANAAAIVGRAYGGTIQSCYVANSYIEGRDHVGSIAGDMNVNDNVGVTISDCLSDAKLKTRSYQVGGLVGVTNGGTIQNCYFSGTIDGKDQWSGGVISLIDNDDHLTTIQNNLSAASHLYKGSQERIIHTAGRKATMINNYAVASMNIGSRGAVFSGTSDAAGSEGETVEYAVAKTRDFYVNTLGWDFVNTWKFLEGAEGKMYPVLSWMNAPLPTEIFDLPNENTSVLYSEGAEFLDLSPIHGSWGQDLKYNITDGASLVSTVDEEPNKIYVGNEDGEFVAAGNVTVSVENSAEVASLLTLSPTSFTFYVDQSGVTTKISTPEQFASLINRNLSGNYQLANDIDMSSYDGFKGIAVSGTPFSGTLDGQGYKVSGLTVTYTDGGSNEGIFGQTAGATFKNIAFENILVDAGSAADHVGFIGSASTTTFDQVAITGKVIGDDHVALLAGDADGITVTNTTLWGTVDGRSQCGGFAGCTLEGGASFDKCLSNVNVSCSFRGWAGGFVGLIDKANSVVSINNCVSLGDMTSAGDGTPRVAAPFIAGNGAGDAANAVINFNENNLYNSEATITADNIDQAWPSTHETADGGSVSAATGMNSTVLKTQATYTNIGWDFDEIWKMDEGSYGYPVLRIFSNGVLNGIDGVATSKATVSVVNGKLNVSGLANGTRLSVYSVSGQKVGETVVGFSSVRMSLPAKGLYIVSVKGGKTQGSFKVLNK